MSKEKEKKIKFSGKKFKWTISIIAILVLIILIAVFSEHGISVITATVKKDNIRAYISQNAKTDLPQIYKITMPYSSRINPVTKAPGAKVKKGEVVASVVLNDIGTKVAVAQSNVADIKGRLALNAYRSFARTAMKEANKWISTMEQITQISKIKITANEHAFEYAIQHKNALIQSGRAVSRISQNEAEMEAAVKEVDLESSRLAYKAMDLFTDIWKLLPIYINEYLHSKDLQRNVLESSLKKAQAELDLANKHLKMAKMTSPVNGIILQRYVTNERFLPIGSKIIDIGVLGQLEVSANVLTTEAVSIKPGNSVDISGTSFGKSIQGKVTKVEPQGFTEISSLGVKQQKVKVKISINKKQLDELLKSEYKIGIGYRVYVKIYTAEAKDTMVVPRTALFRGSNNQWNMFIIQKGKAYLKKVDVGIINDEFAQITSGVKEGDSVIVAPPTTLTNGSKVKIL